MAGHSASEMHEVAEEFGDRFALSFIGDGNRDEQHYRAPDWAPVKQGTTFSVVHSLILAIRRML